MQKVTLDYIFRTTPKILFKRLSTPSGLSEWFADDVLINNGTYTFKWKNNSQVANYNIDKRNLSIKLDWLDEDKEYLEFRIEESDMSKDITLYVIDFIEDDEDIEDAAAFWDDIISRFKIKLGIR